MKYAAVAALAAALAVTALVHPWNDESVTDLPVLQGYSQQFLDGKAPYADVRFEYPTLAWPVLAAAGLHGTGREEFLVGLAVIALLAGAAGVLATSGLGRLADGDPLAAGLGFALTPLLVGAIARNHFELAAAGPAVVGLFLVARGRGSPGLAVLGAAAMVKPFALAAAPVALAWIAAGQGRRAAVRAAAALGAVLAAGVAVALALSPDGAWYAVTFHAERPPQIESSPGVALLATGARTAASFGSVGTASGAGSAVGWLFAVTGLALLGGLTYAAARRPDSRTFAIAAAAALVVPVAFGKVGSPQFLVWAGPLLGVAAALRLWPVALACALGMTLTLAEFPSLYFDLAAGGSGAVLITGLRDAALMAACAAGLAACATRKGRAPALS
jgi:hypothetical protein